MSRYRLVPSAPQEVILREHCAHARYVWNLAVEQQSWYGSAGRTTAPGWVAQSAQLTEARADNPWLAAGSQMVQQQALRDFGQAMANFFAGTHRKPAWRKARRDEGFRIVAVKPERIRRLSRNAGEVWVPKVGWVRFRLSRPVPEGVKSYRVTLDTAGRWHVAFAAVPDPVPGPGTGEVVGADRGVAVSAALSTAEMLSVARLSPARRARLVLLQRKLARAKRGSNRRARTRTAIARIKASEADVCKDWCEKTSTGLARRFDVICAEDLSITNMTRTAKGTIAEPGTNVRQKSGPNREIRRSGWGLLVRRLEDKAPGRVQKVNPAYTSQTCSQCRTTDREARESQAVFRCRTCGYRGNADTNAARNIAAGHAVNARGGDRAAGPVNREPQLALLAS
jgi:putative transposase